MVELPLKIMNFSFRSRAQPSNAVLCKPDSKTSFVQAEVKKKFIPEAGNMASLHDLFSMKMFLLVTYDTAAVQELLKFTRERFCNDDLELFAKIIDLDVLLDVVLESIVTVISMREYASGSCQGDTSVSDTPNELQRILKDTMMAKIPSLKASLACARSLLQSVIYTDVYPRFVLSQITKNVTEAFKEERSKYRGLGDCFCLTDPRQDDNPIVLASDGFLAVTGYERDDVIGRNCRFLQGPETSPSSTTRVKVSIDNKEELVELLTNYKKNGDTFLNLLYITPLFNEAGEAKFFLGCQIDCTTTIHSQKSLLQVLSKPEELPDIVTFPSPITQDSCEPANKYPNPVNTSSQSDEVGQEEALISRLKWMDVAKQVQYFYNVYSNFVVLSYPDLRVRFSSPSMAQILRSPAQQSSPLFGKKIFELMKKSLGFDDKYTKKTVEDALKQGLAVSPVAKLKRAYGPGLPKGLDMPYKAYCGSDAEETKVAIHWTPVKDGASKTVFVVLSFCL